MVSYHLHAETSTQKEIKRLTIDSRVSFIAKARGKKKFCGEVGEKERRRSVDAHPRCFGRMWCGFPFSLRAPQNVKAEIRGLARGNTLMKSGVVNL